MTTDTRTLVMGVPWIPERTKRAVNLAQETGGEVVWDQTHNAFDTWQSVLAIAGDDAVVILEDDVRLAIGWRAQIEEAIAEHPNSIIQFFSLRGEKESGWRKGRTFLMNQCYYLPVGVAKKLLEFSRTWVEENPKFKTGYDITMATWMKQNGVDYWMRVPSLVQHEDWRSEINTKRPRNRQAKVVDGSLA